MKILSLLLLLAVSLCGCATSKPNPANAAASNSNDTKHKVLQALAALAASEAIAEDSNNAKVLQEVSDALNVFCGTGPIDSLFLVQIVNGLPDRLHVGDKTKRRVGLLALLVSDLALEIKPSDYVAFGSLGCAVREGIHRGIALLPTK